MIFSLFSPVFCQEEKSDNLVYLQVPAAVVSSFDDTPDWAPIPNSMAPVDGDLHTRWSSKLKWDNQWIYFDFGKKKTVAQIQILWEAAYAVDYEVLASDDAENWQRVALMEGRKGKLDEISIDNVAARYIKILGIKRVNPEWGISIWEIEFYGPTSLNPEDKPLGEVFAGRKALAEELKTPPPEVVKEEPLPSPGPITRDEFQKGVVYTSWGRNELRRAVSDETLEYLFEKGVRHVSIMVVWFQDTADSKLIWPDTDKDTPTDEALSHAINTCHRLGMKVTLKPHVDLKDDSWRGEIYPSDVWFISYQDFIVHYAKLAAEYNVELFSVGTEFASATNSGFAKQWNNIIDKIKEHYKGPLVYSANWDEYHYVPFWDRLDFIGIDAYFPLTKKKDPTAEELEAAWKGLADTIEKWRELENLQDKPIVFTEIGYSSADGTNKEPWKVFTGVKVDEQEQSDCLEALLTVLTKKSWFKGLYWWNYFPQERFNPTGFLMRAKPAEDILSRWFKEIR